MDAVKFLVAGVKRLRLEANRAVSKEEASCTNFKEGDTTNVGSNKKADANVGGGSTRPGVGK